MAVTVVTSSPKALLDAFKKAINERRIQTWAYDSDGDFTHSAQQWNRAAWMRPSFGTGGLVFTIVAPQGKQISKEVYGIYHGRLIETLLVHFDNQFSTANASALPVMADAVGA
jgi:hypothetical protein